MCAALNSSEEGQYIKKKKKVLQQGEGEKIPHLEPTLFANLIKIAATFEYAVSSWNYADYNLK